MPKQPSMPSDNKRFSQKSDERLSSHTGYGAGNRDTRSNPDDVTPANATYYSNRAAERSGHGKKES